MMHAEKKDFIERVLEWNRAAGNTEGEFNPRQAALYIGLILEEVAELVDECQHGYVWADYIAKAADMFKAGNFDQRVACGDRNAMLDACCDIAVVAVGCAMSLGADVQGAFHEVCDSNDSKLVDGRLLKDENGKVRKPEGYRPPDLSRFLR